MARNKNIHHPIHNRLEWTLRPEAQYIREHPTLLFPMEIPLHQELHQKCPTIPLLGVHALQQVVRIWKPSQDKLQSIDNLQFAIERAGNHPRAHEVERSLGQLAIHAIDLQKPYLRESLGLRRLYVV